jgi:hypothetical protein
VRQPRPAKTAAYPRALLFAHWQSARKR